MYNVLMFILESNIFVKSDIILSIEIFFFFRNGLHYLACNSEKNYMIIGGG